MAKLYATRLFRPAVYRTRLFSPSGVEPFPPGLIVADQANGGGGVATIGGSDPASTNTLYGQTYDPAFTVRPWRLLGVRTGDGVLSFTLPLGHYAFYSKSELAGASSVSFVTYGAITDAEEQSVLWQCLQAAAVRVAALRLPGLANKSILVQDVPWARLFEGENPRLPMPGILICPIGSETIRIATNYRDDVGYPLLISILARNNQELQTYLPRYTLWRNKLVKAFSAGKLPGVQSVITMRVEPGTIVVPEPFHRTIWHSALVVRATSREPRGLGA